MRYPTMQQVDSAGPDQLLRWTRFLPSPGVSAVGREDMEQVRESEAAVLDRIIERQQSLGGITPASSKRVGWDLPGGAE